MKRPVLALINERNFWNKVSVGSPDDCWLWRGAAITRGYGTFTVGNRTFNATHVSLTLDGRERPDAPRHLALHGDCSNPTCVNPHHLRWGTQLENIADKFRLGRNDFRQGESGPRAKLTGAQVIAIRASAEDRRALSARYGVTVSMISAILQRTTWKHI